MQTSSFNIRVLTLFHLKSYNNLFASLQFTLMRDLHFFNSKIVNQVSIYNDNCCTFFSWHSKLGSINLRSPAADSAVGVVHLCRSNYAYVASSQIQRRTLAHHKTQLVKRPKNLRITSAIRIPPTSEVTMKSDIIHIFHDTNFRFFCKTLMLIKYPYNNFRQLLNLSLNGHKVKFVTNTRSSIDPFIKQISH